MEELDNVGGTAVTEGTTAPETTVEAPEKPLSLRDTLRAAAKEVGEKPADGLGAEKPSPTRAPDGKFAPKTEMTISKPVDAGSATPSEPPLAAPPALQAPVSWAPDAKAAFATLAPAVQAAIAKREAEVDQGFKVLQDYKGLDEFTPLIKQAGTTHAEVIKRAVSWENALKSDPVGALRHAASVYGVDLAALAGGQAQNYQQRQQPAAQPAFDPRMIDQKVSEAIQRRDLETAIETFSKDPANKYYDQAKPVMASLLASGQANDLKDAYQKAIWAIPDIRSELIKEQAAEAEKARAEEAEKAKKAAAADQARRASKSISGSSGPGASRPLASNPTSVRAALTDAFALQRGQV